MKKKIDWLITLLPFGSILLLCILFMLFPIRANAVLERIRFFFGDTLGSYYLIIGLGIFVLSIFLACSKYGKIVLGKKGEKPKYSFLSWGAMMFTCGLDFVCLRPAYCRIGKHSGVGGCISFVSLEFYSLELLSGAGSGIRIHAARAAERPAKVFGSLPPCPWTAYRRYSRKDH